MSSEAASGGIVVVRTVSCSSMVEAMVSGGRAIGASVSQRPKISTKECRAGGHLLKRAWRNARVHHRALDLIPGVKREALIQQGSQYLLIRPR
jgi:hypothetical protein